MGWACPKRSIANVVIATFNDLGTVERRFKENPGEIAAIILEPIMMNVGLCMPKPGFLEGLRELCTKNGALLIFDEVKTGAKLAWGGASRIFQREAGHDLPGEIDWRWLAAGGLRNQQGRDGPDLAAQGFPRWDVQHQSSLDGGGSGDVPRSAHAR